MKKILQNSKIKPKKNKINDEKFTSIKEKFIHQNLQKKNLFSEKGEKKNP